MVLHGKRAIVFDHGDWRWVLGNALSRELKEDDGLVARVIQEQFMPERRGVDERDGLSIVQAAVDGGRLLELARSLREWEKHRLLNPRTTPCRRTSTASERLARVACVDRTHRHAWPAHERLLELASGEWRPGRRLQWRLWRARCGR